MAIFWYIESKKKEAIRYAAQQTQLQLTLLTAELVKILVTVFRELLPVFQLPLVKLPFIELWQQPLLLISVERPELPFLVQS